MDFIAIRLSVPAVAQKACLTRACQTLPDNHPAHLGIGANLRLRNCQRGSIRLFANEVVFWDNVNHFHRSILQSQAQRQDDFEFRE